MKTKLFLFCVATAVLATACSKEAGDGGMSSIRGKVYARDYNSSGTFISEGYAPEENVYLSYGDNDYVNDDTKTSYNGVYQFNYLRPGDYTVFVYSKCDTCHLDLKVIKQRINIPDNHSTIELPDFEIRK